MHIKMWNYNTSSLTIMCARYKITIIIIEALSRLLRTTLWFLLHLSILFSYVLFLDNLTSHSQLVRSYWPFHSPSCNSQQGAVSWVLSCILNTCLTSKSPLINWKLLQIPLIQIISYSWVFFHCSCGWFQSFCVSASQADRDVTRMNVFLSLMRLLEQTMKSSSSTMPKGFDSSKFGHNLYPPSSIPMTSLADVFQ